MDGDAIQQGYSNILTNNFSIWEKIVERKESSDRVGILKKVVKVWKR